MLAERRGISSLEEGLKFLDQERETLRKQAIGAGFGKPARRSTREAMIQEGRAIFESAILLCSTQSAPSKPQSPAKRALTL